MEENRIAVLSVIVEKREEAEKLNACLSEFGEYIVGRMGIPYREKHVSVLCVVMDAPAPVVNALTGRIGQRSRSRSAQPPACLRHAQGRMTTARTPSMRPTARPPWRSPMP